MSIIHCRWHDQRPITALSRVHEFMVIARDSRFTYKGRAVDVSEVGRGLGARYVIEGSVRKNWEQVHITVQLIDMDSNSHLWAERNDMALDGDANSAIPLPVINSMHAVEHESLATFHGTPEFEINRLIDIRSLIQASG